VKEIEVNIEVAIEHGLNEDEYNRIFEILGRTPTYTELGIFSVMWSEHCSYKNSIAELKKLPRSGGALLVSAGEENAGLVDIGDGLAIAFKIESHNHPSAVEPYQGAATGVGGIMRDIFTMGARPIAALNSLRLGNIDRPRTQHHLKGIVKGIGDYGNSFGVPTVAGEIYFDDCYNENPLVNAMAVGIVRHNDVARSTAKGEGNSVFIVGSSTGRDGIRGATFASEEISDNSESKRPSVQVGDPFIEKQLLEATLEAIRLGLVVGIQDMGAAGITCSTSEMSAKGKCGMDINLDEVPTREKHMTSYEIMLSESQERMLIIASPENEVNIQNIFDKWDLKCKRIGTVTLSRNLRVYKDGKREVDLPADCLVLGGGAPVYYRDSKQPEYISSIRNLDLQNLPEPLNYNECLIRLLKSPNIGSRNWIYNQYDSMVRGNTISTIGDAAVIRIEGSKKAIAVKTDCNSRYVYLNPYQGAQIAVAECARNVVCVGAKPLAITNCLNFGNPYKADIFWQFKESIKGIIDACTVLNTPVTGGNVSFYNESPDGPIYPTPVIGMLGLMLSLDRAMTPHFKNIGDMIIQLGKTNGHLGGTEHLKVYHNIVGGDAPPIDLYYEKKIQDCCLSLIELGLINSAHDISDGGLAVAIVECCFNDNRIGKTLGAKLTLVKDTSLRQDGLMFGEDQSRIIITVSQRNYEHVIQQCMNSDIEYTVIGEVIEDILKINDLIHIKVEELEVAYQDSIKNKIEEQTVEQ